MAQELKRNVKSVAAAYAVGKRTYYKIQGEKGLLLAVYATGRRTWLVRYQTGKGERRKERTQVIGDAEHVGLAEACKRRAEIMAEAGRGGGTRGVRRRLANYSALGSRDMPRSSWRRGRMKRSGTGCT